MLTLLERARDLIIDSDHWCALTNAQDRKGDACGSTSPRAIRWCSNGALMHERQSSDQFNGYKGTGEYYAAADELNAASKELFNVPYIEVNDVQGHAAVISVFNLAIHNKET